MASSARFEDLSDDLSSIREKVKLQTKHNINEVTINKMLSEGDAVLNLMKKEVDGSPLMVRSELLSSWQNISKDWSAFKSSVRSSSTLVRINSGDSALNRGLNILERTGDSLARAEAVARESEQIGQEVIGELGEQRESLLRTRERLDNTNQDLNRANRIVRSINRRVLTNKCMLIFIIFLEAAILLAIVYLKFLRPLFKK